MLLSGARASTSQIAPACSKRVLGGIVSVRSLSTAARAACVAAGEQDRLRARGARPRRAARRVARALRRRRWPGVCDAAPFGQQAQLRRLAAAPVAGSQRVVMHT